MTVWKVVSTGVALAIAVLAAALLAPTSAPRSALAAETALVVTGTPSGPGGGSSTATCPSGSHLTGGGYRLQPDADGPVRASGPTADATGWSTQSERGSVVAYAVCEGEG